MRTRPASGHVFVVLILSTLLLHGADQKALADPSKAREGWRAFGTDCVDSGMSSDGLWLKAKWREGRGVGNLYVEKLDLRPYSKIVLEARMEFNASRLRAHFNRQSLDADGDPKCVAEVPKAKWADIGPEWRTIEFAIAKDFVLQPGYTAADLGNVDEITLFVERPEVEMTEKILIRNIRLE